MSAAILYIYDFIVCLFVFVLRWLCSKDCLHKDLRWEIWHEIRVLPLF